MTNILQMLHTTAAYQSAVMQLMVNEANFAAKQLDLKETVPPIVATDSNRWSVEPVTEGIGGSVDSENYSFWFHNGKLRSIDKIKWFQKISPPANSVLDLADRPSLLDTNSAYQLAKERLAALSVDVAALEKEHPPTIFQVRGKKRGPNGEPLTGSNTLISSPLFMIGWGESPVNPILQARMRELNRPMPVRPPSDLSPVFVEFLGTTRELIDLKINDPSLLKRPVLQLTNAEQLLGPTPPPQHFVEEFVGGKDAYETISKPDKVEVWLLTAGIDHPKVDRAGPVKLTAVTAKAFSDALLNFDSYSWRDGKQCIMDEGARLRFTRGADTVDIRLCYQCDMLTVTHKGSTRMGDFDYAHNALAKALQAAFPNDEIVKALQLKGTAK
jgi:hypothetical protein